MRLPSLIGPEGLDLLCKAASNSPPGAIVEIGVYQGGSAIRLYEVAEKQGRTLYLYDTFQGHPHHDPTLDDHALGRFADAATPERLQALMPNAVIVQGVFPQSLVLMEPVAFVHADGDLYQTTRDVCEHMPRHMVVGGVLWFDDYSHPDTRGCRAAVDEAFPHRTVLPSGQAVVHNVPVWLAHGDRSV